MIMVSIIYLHTNDMSFKMSSRNGRGSFQQPFSTEFFEDKQVQHIVVIGWGPATQKGYPILAVFCGKVMNI